MVTTINDWTGLKPFAGKLIAYKTDANELGARIGFVESIKFAYVIAQPEIKGDECGYRMARLVRMHDVSDKCVVTDKVLEKKQFSVREVTEDERAEIIASIGRVAKLEFIFHSIE